MSENKQNIPLFSLLNLEEENIEEDEELKQNFQIIRMITDTLTNHAPNYDSGVRYRYPYKTGLDNTKHAEPVSLDELQEIGIDSSQAVYEELLRAGSFYKLIQLQPAEFVVLLKQLKQVIISTTIPNNPISHQDIDTSGEKHPRISRRSLQPADQLYAFLLSLMGERDVIVSRMCECSESTIQRNFNFMMKVVIHALSGELAWPDREERKQLYNLFPVYEKAVIVLDGTHCEIKIPGDLDDEDSTYSGYKHKHTQLFMIYIDAHGFFRRIEGPWNGEAVDRGAFNESEIQQNTAQYLSEGEYLLVDGGFAGDGPILYPYNKVALKNAGSDVESYKAYNFLLTESRSLVEHAIHRLKARAPLLAGRFPKDKERMHEVVCVAAIIFNWTRKLRILKIQQLKNSVI